MFWGCQPCGLDLLSLPFRFAVAAMSSNNVIKAQVLRDIDLLKNSPKLARSIMSSPDDPDVALENQTKIFSQNRELLSEPVDLTKVELSQA